MDSQPRRLALTRGRAKSYRPLQLETLESRVVLSAVTPLAAPTDDALAALTAAIVAEPLHGEHEHPFVTITDREIITNTEIFPRFAASPTNVAVRSGNWNSASTWSAGRVPVSGDRVAINEGVTVQYSAVGAARIDALEISGALVFSNTVNTRLTVANLMVLPMGRLEIGTAAAPVAAGVKAELIIADKSLDLAVDPRQYGTGLIVLGEITIHGAAVSDTWTKLAAEPRAGDTSVLLSEAVTGWRAGDTIVLPDSRQVPSSQEDAFRAGRFAAQWEEVVISRVVGNRVFLTAPLQFDHPGARNLKGALEQLPHVALLNRNVVIRSENPNGTRGHTMYNARAKVDIEYARFQDLGRTDAFRNLDSTTFDAQGNVTRLGTNQIGRYAVHLHHMPGPENPTNSGFQYKFVGNTVDGAKRWAIAIHGTSFGLVDQNVLYDAQGAGLVTEDGSEIGNVISNNISIRMQGTFVDGKNGAETGDFARGGSGFWFRRGGNMVIGNVAADSTYAGFVIDGYFVDSVRLPLFRGADPHDPRESYVAATNPGGTFAFNEAYGVTTYGVWFTFVNGMNSIQRQLATNVFALTLWHIHDTGVLAYHTNNLLFNRLTILGDINARDRNDAGPRGMDLKNYGNYYLEVRNARIEGMYTGILAPTSDASRPGKERPTQIQNSVLKNYINIAVSPARRGERYNALEVRNVLFELADDVPPGPSPAARVRPPANIAMLVTGENLDYTGPSVVRVYNYNRVAGDNFQVYYREQAASYVLPKTDPRLLGSRVEGTVGMPVGGLTNAQAWNMYGLAMAGAVAPSAARASRPEINGLIAPIADLSAIVPRIVFVTPWNDAVLTDNRPVRIRYNVIGLLPPGADVFFRIDNGAPFDSRLQDGGPFNVPAGTHTLRAYFGDAQGRQIAGIPSTSIQFTIRL